MNQRKPNWLRIAFIACFFAVGIPYWKVPYNQGALPNDLIGAGLLLVGVASVLLCATRESRFWRVVLVAGGSVPAAVVARIFAEGLQDPTTHNLAPFEVILALMVAIPAALIGALLGSLIARLRGEGVPGAGGCGA